MLVNDVDEAVTNGTKNGAPTNVAQFLPIEIIRPSPLNPAGRTKGLEFDELVASVKTHGILVPILVRPVKVGYEVVAGHRRLAAARAAGLLVISAVARELSDEQSLELQLIENLQRSDIHPLDEAEGYRSLHREWKLPVARIAEKIGRTVVYVYDRLKLNDLTPELKKHFRDEDIAAGHAVVLARLSQADQKRALKDALFVRESGLLFDADEPRGDRARDPMKAVSARELQAWVNKHVRFNTGDVDHMLFPETALALEAAPKVIPITTEHYIPDEARTKERTFFPASWKRADGRQGSKTCEYAVLGAVVIGARKGDAFQVCVSKDRCLVHWASEIRERKAATKRRETGTAKVGERAKPAADPKQQKALQEALEREQEKAHKEIQARVIKAAGALSHEAVLRVLAGACEYELREYLTVKGLSVERGKVGAWAKKAPIQLVKESLVYAQYVNGDEDFLKALGIDADPIWKLADKRARESLKEPVSTTPNATKPTKSKKRTR
jgi:ParB/RepB/Spo0J family partition protein